MVIRYNGITIDREKRTISHGEQSYTFLGKRRGSDVSFPMLCHMVLGPGLSVHEMFDLIYREDPDGGPIEGPHMLLVTLNQMEKKCLKKLGLEWRAWRIASVNFYCIVPTYQLTNPKHQVMYKNLRRPQKHKAQVRDAG